MSPYPKYGMTPHQAKQAKLRFRVRTEEVVGWLVGLIGATLLASVVVMLGYLVAKGCG